MKKRLLTHICRTVAVLLFLFTVMAHCCDGVGEWYARALYPTLSLLLSLISAVVPVSLEELLAVAVALGLVGFIVMSVRKRKGWKHVLGRLLLAILGIYTWFYWGWGMNYYRDSIYQRVGCGKQHYDEEEFMDFLNAYTARLNASYVSFTAVPMQEIEEAIKSQFAKVKRIYGLTEPQRFQHPKRVMFGRLYSSVGVLGYMGPFFAESQLNPELLPSQLPFTYAHELSHLLGVASEAEANYWAYRVCTASEDERIRYSGYFGIFGYVAANARKLLSKDDYAAWLSTVRQEVMEERMAQQDYWHERYDKTLGMLQDKVYDLYLRRNKISSGRKNYAEVVGYIISLPDDCWRQ